MARRTFGVEEELLLVSQSTLAPVPLAQRLLLAPEVAASGPQDGVVLDLELQQEMIESITPPHDSSDDLAADIGRGRRWADEAAQRFGARALPLSVSPVTAEPHPTLRPRYLEMMECFGVTARTSLVCGCHVHVSVRDQEEGVAVLDRIRNWLPIILALSTNSPYCNGSDSGYASYRSQFWSQWPSSGPTDLFGSPAVYRRYEECLLETGVLLDAGMLYLDARLSRRHPTVEVRVADVCLRAEDTVVIAALVRALVDTVAEDWDAGVAPLPIPTGVLRLAMWRARFSGLDDLLVHPESCVPAPAVEAVWALVEKVCDALVRNGDEELAIEGVHRILFRGTGADWQRRVARAHGVEEIITRLCRVPAARR